MGLVNKDEFEWTELNQGKMRIRRKKLGEKAGGKHLGCSLYELPPGEESWPYHYHTANEEAIYVLEGTGLLRLSGDTFSLTKGHYIALPSSENGGHKVINNSETELQYLVVSTMNEPDIAVYPDSEKIGIFVGSPPGGEGERTLHGYYQINDNADYWKDE